MKLGMSRLLLALTGALGLAVALPGAVSAAPPPPAPSAVASGAPSVSAASTFGYYIWMDGDRVHLRTTDPGGAPALYTGEIVTNGTVRHVDLIQPEDGDWAVASGGTLAYHFTTWNAVDGVSFDAQGATRLTFRLYRNGHLISTEHIFLGAGGSEEDPRVQHGAQRPGDLVHHRKVLGAHERDEQVRWCVEYVEDAARRLADRLCRQRVFGKRGGVSGVHPPGGGSSV